jgi:phosphoribosyl 1,2-cyclic phosphate phosphodiesterase
MQVTFLGTGASEGSFNAHGLYGTCERARQPGGPSLCKRSAALIDGELLIDLGPDLRASSLMHGIPVSRICFRRQTHERHDHLEPSHFFSRSRDCQTVEGGRHDDDATRGALAHSAHAVKVDLDVDELIR